jgi:hypothetical protein
MSLSVIITASFIKSHPSIEFIKYTIESLGYINLKEDTPIFLAHDYNSSVEYIQYLENLEEYIKDKPFIKIIRRETHGHLTGNIRNAFNFVTSKYILILQHDLPFIRKLEIENIIQDMENTPELKHIRFNKRKNIKVASDALNDLFGRQTVCKYNTYTRTPSWSDQNHICRADYYRDLILKECNDGNFMEIYLIKRSTNEEIHKIYGTYLFGKLNEPAYIRHIDGKKNNDVLKLT